MRNYVLLLACLGVCVALATPGAFSQEAGEVYFWHFNEGEGDIVTDTDGRFPVQLGTTIGEDDLSQSSDDSPSGDSGDLSLDIGMGLTAIDENDDLNIIEGPITMEAWIKVETLNDTNGIMAHGSSYKMGINNGELVFTFYGIVDIFSGVMMEADNTWHHVAAVWEPEIGVSFYVDGEFATFVEETGFPRELQSNILNIGSETNGGSRLVGLIDRARIHNAVLDETQLDSDAANPMEPLENTLVSYSFDGGSVPYENGTDIELPAINTAPYLQELYLPEFVEDTPAGEEGDYALFFDGDDYGIYHDEEFLLDFWDEDFTFEAWLKFDPDEQTADRPIIASYGIGGQYGYSFSFRPLKAAVLSEDSPSGQAGDYSAQGATVADDSEDPILEITEGPITIEAWFKLNSLSGWTDILRYDTTYKAGFDDEGNLLFTMLAVEDVRSTVPAPVDQEWHHVAYVWEPGTGVTFYLDGEEVEFVETANTNQELENNTLSVGSDSSGGSLLDGQLDRVRVHNAVLSADQLDSDAANPAEPLADTIAYYNYDEGSFPVQNMAGNELPLDTMYKGSPVTVTTYGIVDAHSTDAVLPDDGQWHHIAVAHEFGVEFRYYIDGELKETRDYVDGVNLVEDVTDFRIAREGGGLYYTGLMDRLRISRAAFTDEELDYFEPVPVADWSLY